MMKIGRWSAGEWLKMEDLLSGKGDEIGAQHIPHT
jgi:hypothetical protein